MEQARRKQEHPAYQTSGLQDGDTPIFRRMRPRTWSVLALAPALLLYPLSRFNYLLFHFLVEIFFVVVAFTLFSIGWNAREVVRDNALMILAASFLAIGSVELIHLLSYKGMGVLSLGPDPATQLWIVARYLESAAFLAAACSLGRAGRLRPSLLLAGAVAAALLPLLLIWPLDIFPVCFVEGAGLTPFKVASEYLVCALFGLAMALFWKRRELLDPGILHLLLGAVGFSILAELSFTLYVDVHGFTNFLGHYLKLISVVFIYRALVIGTLRTPYTTLFRDLVEANEGLDRELGRRRRVEKELRETNRELDAFVRTVSHDLRTPLTPIIGYADFLRIKLNKDHLDDEARQALEAIRRQGLRMAQLLEDLLTFARAGRFGESSATIQLDALIRDVLEDHHGLITDRRLRIEVHTLPEIAVPRTAWFQVLSNLVSNAAKYGKGDEGRIEIGCEESPRGRTLFVRDHGPGIPEEQRERIFEVFYRDAEDDAVPGSGIGLATVSKIARSLGEAVWVEETPGGGSTFRVTLNGPASGHQKTDGRCDPEDASGAAAGRMEPLFLTPPPEQAP